MRGVEESTRPKRNVGGGRGEEEEKGMLGDAPGRDVEKFLFLICCCGWQGRAGRFSFVSFHDLLVFANANSLPHSFRWKLFTLLFSPRLTRRRIWHPLLLLSLPRSELSL